MFPDELLFSFKFGIVSIKLFLSLVLFILPFHSPDSSKRHDNVRTSSDNLKAFTSSLNSFI